jgi:RHS repeat-associated protein
MRHSSFLSRRILWILPVLGLLATKPLLAQSGPSLNIVPSGTGEVQISWLPDTNFNVLEESLGLEGTNAWFDVPQAPSPLGLFYSVREATTNGATFYRLAQRGTPGVNTPPDPSSVAPPLSPNVFNPFGPSTAFLYTGQNPIQIGVAPGTIKAIQAAVLRGTVRGRDYTPLPGVRVAVLNHPEFGYTYTRTNGLFDLAVNASQYTVDFNAIGYLEVQRQAQLTGQSYHTLRDVVMIGLDSMSTVVTLGSNAPLQVAHSTPQTDAAGTRSATLFVPAGTTATMVLADGSKQAMSTLTVRVTEFTVGSNGPAAMPAPLPPNSAYTYCAEFGADEEMATGATTVIFSQPLPVYVDNFRNMPVGMLMPVGNYDRAKAAWIPLSNGIVMQILGSSNGIALVDLHGTGTPEPTNVLAANGFTLQELEQLATLYSAGKTLWRCWVPHFDAPYDLNSKGNKLDPNPQTQGDSPPPPLNDPEQNNNGTLNFSAQTFTESIPLVGVPFNLNYNSARVPDYRVLGELTVPITYSPLSQTELCSNLPPGVPCEIPLPTLPRDIRVDLDIFGRDTYQILPITNTSATVSWDGMDPYGRLVGGSGQAGIMVAYEWTNWDYGGILGGPELSEVFPALFGNDGNNTTFYGAGPVGTAFDVGEYFQQILTVPDHRALGFGGWSPTVLHRLDPVAGILYYGDGRIRTVPQAALSGDFLQFGIAPLQRVVAAAPDGSVYFDGQFTDTNGEYENFIFRLLPGGTFTTITASIYTAGTVQPSGINWSPVDGQSATNVSLGGIDLAAMSVGPDGSLYVTDGYCVARLTPDGIWHVIMGLNASFPPVLQPDGTPATNSYLSSGGRVCMATGPDSSVYFTSTWGPINGTNYSMIRKIAPNGNLYTVFGAPGAPVSQEGSPVYWNTLYGSSAFSAPYGGGPIQAIAVGSDGTVYVSPGESDDGGGMFKISTGGIILPFLSFGPETGAGAGYNPLDTIYAALIQGDEGRAATAVTSGNDPAQTMAVGPDGSVYFTPDGFIVWRVDPDGILERVAGRYGYTTYGAPDLPASGGDPLNTEIYEVYALAVTPNDTLVLNRGNSSMLPNILLYPGRTAQQGLIETVTTLNIPSEDGSEIYVFDQTGRHYSTLDSLTGATQWTFGYDANSLVVTMTDVAGNVTQIRRNGAGLPTAIVGPYGQTTTLGVDANGFLNKVTNPANETTTMTSTSGGLLSSITGPLNDTYSVSYDNLGRMTQVSDPLGGGWTDTDTYLGLLPDSSYEINVACTNSVGDTLYRAMNLGTDRNTTEAYFDGTNRTAGTITAPNGDETLSFADGSMLHVGVGADPRFGSQVQQPTSVLFQVSNTLPAYTVSIQYSARLANNLEPLSLTGLTNVATINGNTYTGRYVATNRVITLTTPAGRITTGVLDTLGRLSHLAQAGYPVADIAYDSNGRLAAIANSSSIGVATTTFAYNGLGQRSGITDSLGRALGFSYDAAGRITQEALFDGAVAAFTSDSEYDLTSVTPPGRPAHTFQYNAVGSLAKYTPPLVGSDESVGFAYDTERDLTQVNYPDGQIETFQYGLAARLEQAVLGAGPTLTFQYGGQDPLQLTGITSSTGDALQFQYTGPILTGAAWSGTITGQVMMQLNTDLLPASQSVDGSTVAYSYDPDLLLTQAGDLSVTRDPASGFVTGTRIGVVTDHREYDDAGLLTNYTASAGGPPLWSLAMSYDLIGRLTNKVETIGGVTNTSGYIYDIDGRLGQVWQNGVLGVTYTYDTNGNRLTRNAETATYDAQDRVQSYDGTTFGWSPNGTLQTSAAGGQTTNYTYDVRGELTAVALPGATQIGYVTDGAGRRIGKQVNGSLQGGWLWNSNLVVAQVDGNSSLTEQFIYGADYWTPSYMIAGANIYRILSDPGGSVRLVVNVVDGTVAQQLDYDEFGRVLGDSNPGFQPFGFAGGLYDPDTGLVRFGARDYSSETGQWTARDPLLFTGAQYSLYAYVANDPINFLDPLGTGPRLPEPEGEEHKTYTREVTEAGVLTAVGHLAPAVEPGIVPIHLVEAGVKEGEVIHVIVNEISDGQLDKSQREMKELGPVNMQDPQLKNQPFDPFPWLHGW